MAFTKKKCAQYVILDNVCQEEYMMRDKKTEKKFCNRRSSLLAAPPNFPIEEVSVPLN